MMIDESLRLRFLRILSRPLVAYCLRHAHSLRDLIAAVKINFVELAEEEMRRAGTRINVSRISVRTGVHRTDVTQIIRERVLPTGDTGSVVLRVIGQWRHDKRFSMRANKPRILSCEGPESEFHQLVNSVTMNVHPAAVLGELLRSGFARKTKRGLKLLLQMQALRSNPEEGFKLLSRDLDTLLRAGEQNLFSRPAVSNLHIRTEYDNVVLSEIENVRIWLRDEGKVFHKRAREYISQFDKDVNQSLANEAGGGYVVLGAFSWAESEHQADK